MKPIEITTGMNGYPQGLHRGYIDFESFEQAEEFAKKYNGRVVSLHQRGGWQLWESQGTMYEPYEIGADTYGEDYREFSNKEEYEEDVRETLRNFIDDNMPINDIKDFLNKDVSEVLDELETAGEDEVVITYQGHYFKTTPTKVMNYTEDVHIYSIGVEIDGYNEEADWECD